MGPTPPAAPFRPRRRSNGCGRGASYVVRLRSPGSEENRVKFDDMIKGTIEMPENDEDLVLLKSDGVPTYHFAHAVDDHLMRTTHVIRGDEWISSVPKHLQLFRLLGFKPPKYAHVSPIMKEENGGKRKLSKRKDPELALTFYAQEGYPVPAVLEYLMTLLNSNFEEWRRANPDLPMNDFQFTTKKMSGSGALFDIEKLRDVSKNVISRMTAEQVYDFVAEWSAVNDKEFNALLTRDPAFSKAYLAIGRGRQKAAQGPRAVVGCQGLHGLHVRRAVPAGLHHAEARFRRGCKGDSERFCRHVRRERYAGWLLRQDEADRFCTRLCSRYQGV